MATYPTEAELQARRSAIEAQLLDMAVNPKPSYQIDDRRLEWNSYARELRLQLRDLNQALASLPAFIETRFDDPTGL